MTTENGRRGPDEPTIPEGGPKKPTASTGPTGPTGPIGPQQAPELRELAERGVSGTEMVAICGNTEDGEVKELPKGTTIVETTIRTENPTETFEQLKALIKLERGSLIPTAPSRTGTLRIQASLPNLNQALQLRVHIKTIDRSATTTISQNKGYISTHGATVMALGPAFKADENPGQQTPDTTKGAIDFSHSQAGEPARAHAGRLANLEEQHELPTEIEVIRIKIPEDYDINEKSIKAITGRIDAISSRRKGMNRVVVNGNVITVFTGGERGPGHNVKRAGKLDIDELKRLRFTAVVDHVSDVEAHQLESGEWIYQGDFEETFPTEFGLFETERFAKAYEKDPRNASVATREMEEATDGFIPITNVSPKNYEIAIPEDEITIGREKENKAMENRLKEMMEGTQVTGVTMVLSKAGGGKTHFAKDIQVMCRELGLRHIYARASEEDTTVPFSYIRSLGAKYLDALKPEQRGDFEVLRHFIEETEESRLSGFAKRVLSEMKNNKAVIAAEIDRLKRTVAENFPTVTQVDDLHWADPASIDILTTLIRNEKEDPHTSSTRHHLVVLSRTEEVIGEGVSVGPPAPVTAAVTDHPNTKTIELEAINNSKGTYDKTGEFAAAKLSRTMGRRVSATEIPETFLQQVYNLYENHPLSTEQLIRLLEEKGLIKTTTDGSLKMPSVAEVDALGDSIKTIDSIIQGRFSEVSEDGKAVFDLLITLDEPVAEDVIFTLLEANGISKTTATLELSNLQQRELIKRIQKNEKSPITYQPAHALIVKSRKAQIKDGAKEAQLAHLYSEAIKGSSAGIKRQLTPTLVFNLLLKAAGRGVVDNNIQTEELANLLSTARRAIKAELKANNNLLAVAIAEKTLFAIGPLESLVEEGTDANAMTRRKCEVISMLAEGYRRTGRTAEAQEMLRTIETTAKDKPEAQILEGTELLRHQAMSAELVFVRTQDAEKVEAAATELQETIARLSVTTTIEGVVDPGNPEITIAKGTLELTKLIAIGLRAANPTQADRAKEEFGESEERCEVILQKLDKIDHPRARRIALTLKRRLDIAKYLVLMEEAQGVGEESIYMQTFEGPTRTRIEGLKEKFTSITDGWSAHPELLAVSPHQVAYNYMILARLAHLAGDKEQSESVLAEGMRLAKRLYAIQPLAVLHQVAGDIVTFGNLGKHGIDFKEWDEDQLETAIQTYETGQSELRRVKEGAEGAYGRPIVINQTAALAALVHTKIKKESIASMNDEELDELKAQVERQWTRMTRTLEILAKDYNPGENPMEKCNQDYLKETSTLGLLMNAAKALGLDVEIPDTLPTESFVAQLEYVKSRQDDPSLTDADRRLLEFSRMGSEMLLQHSV